MEAVFGIIFTVLIGVVMCALLSLLFALFAQWAMKFVVKRMPAYGKAYVVVFKITLIGFIISVLLQQVAMLSPTMVFVTIPLNLIIWLGGYSYLYGIWFTHRHKPIGFVRGLLVNLVISLFAFVLGLIVAIPFFFLAVSQEMNSVQ
ncbi:MAG: hypothetical protein Q7Q73_00830 [Verrucomicrobiota bacterium JB024]|nr:hypothetical protein [Verrucomicrobiota bacterium JB024]